MTAGVYKITNMVNGKEYVGISNDIERRWRDEKCGSSIKRGGNSLIEKAIQKYGKEMFHFEIIDELNEESDRLEAEKMFIKRYNTKAPNGYNLTDGGEGACGRTHSQETRSKISQNSPKYWSGKNFSEEHKNNLSKNHANVKMENNPMWKNNCRIVKNGCKKGKQKYALRHNGKMLKQSIYVHKLLDYAKQIGLDDVEVMINKN